MLLSVCLWRADEICDHPSRRVCRHGRDVDSSTLPLPSSCGPQGVSLRSSVITPSRPGPRDESGARHKMQCCCSARALRCTLVAAHAFVAVRLHMAGHGSPPDRTVPPPVRAWQAFRHERLEPSSIPRPARRPADWGALAEGAKTSNAADRSGRRRTARLSAQTSRTFWASSPLRPGATSNSTV